MSNITKDSSWFQRNKQALVLGAAVVVLVLFAAAVIYVDATTTMRLI